jgi:hypothetical protein
MNDFHVIFCCEFLWTTVNSYGSLLLKFFKVFSKSYEVSGLQVYVLAEVSLWRHSKSLRINYESKQMWNEILMLHVYIH